MKLPKDALFEITVLLRGVEPFVWRKIDVPASYTFWDLHVAIQDAFGWLDCHLHQFIAVNEKTGTREHIGIPSDEDDDVFVASWERKIADFLSPYDQPTVDYQYDFGDDWWHVVMLTGMGRREKGKRYPRCTGGERACPPEDCGGVHGYEEFRRAISDPTHDEHASMLEWVGGSFSPESFDPSKVRFDSPKKRLAMVLEGMQM